jgi:hypothetical protein
VLTSGVLVERDCQNRTVGIMPNLAGNILSKSAHCHQAASGIIWYKLRHLPPFPFNAVTSPAPGSSISSPIGTFILTTEPEGPSFLLPRGNTNTTNPTPPDAVLLQNCTLQSYNSFNQVVYTSNAPSDPPPAGPCRLILSSDGVLYISDLGRDSAIVWSNEDETNMSTSSCSPYSLTVLSSGVLVQRDCANITVRCRLLVLGSVIATFWCVKSRELFAN